MTPGEQFAGVDAQRDAIALAAASRIREAVNRELRYLEVEFGFTSRSVYVAMIDTGTRESRRYDANAVTLHLEPTMRRPR